MTLGGKLRVMLHNPLLHELAKLLGLLHKFLSLCVCRYIRHIIIEYVPLPTTGIKITCQRGNAWPHGEF